LEPIYWNEDVDNGLLSCPFELFPMDDPLIVDPINVPTMHQPNLIETHVPPPSSSALLTDDCFTNPPQYLPYLENHCEQPVPQQRRFVKPEVTGYAPVASYHQQQMSADDESSELDFALAAPEADQLPSAPPTTQITHPPYHQYHHYHAPPPAVYRQQPMMYGQPQSSPYKVKRSHRVIEDEDDDISAFETEPIDFGDEEDPTGGFKLPASKSPIMEAMVVCALKGGGIDIITNNRPTSTTPAEVVFRVTDFNRYYKISRAICSKQRPTDDLGSRIKSLRRWFVNFPKKKDRCENSFNLIVKPAIAKKVNEIIERNSKSLGLTKRRRRQ
jgi:hypothetical protein